MLIIKQLSYWTDKMATDIKSINIKNHSYYFFNDMINVKDFKLKFVENRQKVVQKHWYLQHWLHHN